MKIRLQLPDPTDKAFDAVIEQNSYLEGVLWADKAHRLDLDSSRDVSTEIDAYGTGNKHFWRGVLETAGSLNDYANGNYYPRMELKGSYSFLIKFVDFLQEEMAREGMGMHWIETDEKLRFMASGGKVRFSGEMAQHAVKILYADANVTRESFGERVNRIWSWTSAR
jgi:hypothetical protein